MERRTTSSAQVIARNAIAAPAAPARPAPISPLTGLVFASQKLESIPIHYTSESYSLVDEIEGMRTENSEIRKF